MGIILKNRLIIFYLNVLGVTKEVSEQTMSTKSRAVILLSIVVLATVATGLVLATQAAANADTSSSSYSNSNVSATTSNSTDENPCIGNGYMLGDFGNHHMMNGFGTIQVSDEFKQNVTSIAENDSDVQNLLNDGYNITSIKPIITSTVDGNGNVVSQATSAVVILQKDSTDSTGVAYVLVDLTQAQVTRIETITRTIIEK